jgi:hypothetical protein
MAIFNFTNPGQYGSAYFTLETVPNSQGFFDSSSFPNAQGYYSNFTNLNESYIVTSSYVFGVVVPPGSSSFEFNPSNSAMPTGSLYFRGTGGIGITVDTYSGSYVVSPSQGYNGSVLNTFPLTPVPNFQARVSANSGSYEALSCQNTILADIGTEILSSASLLVTPNGYTEGVLFGTLPNSSSGDFTVTRATTATRVNAAGLVELVPYNLLTYSEQFNNAAWSQRNTTATANTTTAPNGTLTGDSLIPNATNDQHRADQTPISTAGTQTFSVYVKDAGYNFVGLRIGLVGSMFNLTNGAASFTSVGCTASSESVGDGWYRCILTKTAGATNDVCRINVSDGTGIAPDFSGDNTSGLFIWGAQLVEGTNALPYQPTTTRLNISRADYSQGGCPNILLEPQRTNLVLASEQFDSGSWAKQASTITPNTAISPSGILNADTFTANGLLAEHNIIQGGISTLTSGSTYTTSIYAKKNTNNFIQIVGTGGVYGGNTWVNFDLNNGTVGLSGSSTTANITNAGNGWYRCTMTATAVSTTNTNTFIALLVTSATSGRGEINSLNTSVFLWGAQVEAGAYATTYIPTTSTTVTRNGDTINRGNIYTNGLLTAGGGTWFIDFRNNLSYIRDTSASGLYLTDATGLSFGFRIKTYSPGNRLAISKVIAAGETPLYTTTTDTSKVAIKWNGTIVDIFVNGVKVVNSSAFTDTQMQRITTDLSVPIYINSMGLAPIPLSDSQCIELTTL